MSLNNNQNQTGLDYIAESYWQDYLSQRPIEGGVSYERLLRQCQLDDTPASLKRLDDLLEHIRQDIVGKPTQNEHVFLNNEAHRRLLLFIAFYAGQVLAKIWRSEKTWYGQTELKQHYPTLAIINGGFYHFMAMKYSANGKTRLFFPLEPIGMRLFGNPNNPVPSVLKNQVANGLYEGICQHLPKSYVEKLNVQLEKQAQQQAQQQQSQTQQIQQPQAIQQSTTNHQTTPSTITQPQATTGQTTLNGQQANYQNPQNTFKPTQNNGTERQDIFTELRRDLENIQIEQQVGVKEYQSAINVLEKFDSYIAKQNKPLTDIEFSEKQQSTRIQALKLLQHSAKQGNTSAMLKLSTYYLLGEGVSQNEQAGIEWIQKSANANDSRGQRLLSKLYYQGVGIAQDMTLGEYWLKKASENGHPEAQRVESQMVFTQNLLSEHKDDQQKEKRYILMLAGVVVLAILLALIVPK